MVGSRRGGKNESFFYRFNFFDCRRYSGRYRDFILSSDYSMGSFLKVDTSVVFYSILYLAFRKIYYFCLGGDF